MAIETVEHRKFRRDIRTGGMPQTAQSRSDHDRERGDVGAGGHRRRGLEDIEEEVREGQRPSLADDASPMDEYERGGGRVEGSCE